MEIYLDNAAATKPCKSAADAMLLMLETRYANPDSLHAAGLAAEREIIPARESIAKSLGAESNEIYFTSGGTESNNWAVFGTAALKKRQGRHIITTSAEHPSVLNPVKKLETDGFEVTYINPGKDGNIDAAEILAAVRDDTVLVSVMTVNNETGNIFPVSDISAGLKKLGSRAIFHTDAVQGFLKIPISAKSLGAQLISLSGHKVFAPKGIGALYIKNGIKLPPVFYGGGQERALRPGTSPTPLICAFGAAAEEGVRDFTVRTQTLKELNSYARDKLENSGIKLLSAGGAPHILSLSLPGYMSEVLVRFLSEKGIYVSSGSACAKGKTSHVLSGMGLSKPEISGAIRISLAHYNTKSELDALFDALSAAKSELIKIKM